MKDFRYILRYYIDPGTAKMSALLNLLISATIPVSKR